MNNVNTVQLYGNQFHPRAALRKNLKKMIKRVNAPLLLDLFLGLVLMNRVVTDGIMSLFVHL